MERDEDHSRMVMLTGVLLVVGVALLAAGLLAARWLLTYQVQQAVYGGS